MWRGMLSVVLVYLQSASECIEVIIESAGPAGSLQKQSALILRAGN
jgi:hypothetical protein